MFQHARNVLILLKDFRVIDVVLLFQELFLVQTQVDVRRHDLKVIHEDRLIHFDQLLLV